MEQKENLEELKQKLREKNQELESMEQLSSYEKEEEDVRYLFQKNAKANETMWNHFGGRKAGQYFLDLEQDEKSYYKKMQISFQDKYDEIEHKKEELVREREELSEKFVKINEEKLKAEKEKESNSVKEK